MFKKLIYTICAVFSLVLMSCDDDSKSYVAPARIQVIKANLTFTPAGGTNMVETDAEGTLTATSSSKWLTVQVEGSNLRLTADANDDLQTRTAIITLQADNGTATLTAQQSGLIISLDAESSYVFGASDNADATISSMSNIDFDATLSGDWMHWTKTVDGYAIHVDDNEGNYRAGTITLKYRDFEKVISIVQWGTIYPFAQLNTATYEDEEGNVYTKSITVVPDTKEGNYLIKGLLDEGDISLQANAASGATDKEWFIPSGYTPGTNTEDGTKYTLRCMISTTNLNTGNRYIPTSVTTAANSAYRIAFKWEIGADDRLSLVYVRNSSLSDTYSTDGFIVCKYTSTAGANANARKGIAYYFLNIKLTAE
jgi:hypothetical protein